MIALGMGVFFAGYSVLVYGWSQLNGSNVSFVDLLWPGKWDGQLNKDSGNAATASGTKAPTAGQVATKNQQQTAGPVGPAGSQGPGFGTYGNLPSNVNQIFGKG